MKNTLYKYGKIATLTATYIIAGCAGGGYNNSGLANSMGNSVLGSAGGNPLNAVGNAILQNMAASVLNGQIGSQIAPVDQSFRLQQLGSAVQSGAVNQAQQWVNPQTGSMMAINPVGQNIFNQQTQQQCQNLEEVVTLQNGQTLTENRLACLNPQTGKWALVK